VSSDVHLSTLKLSTLKKEQEKLRKILSSILISKCKLKVANQKTQHTNNETVSEIRTKVGLTLSKTLAQ
jgi:hypothetical protein